MFNCTCDYNFFKIFGCACYPLLRPYNKNKFSFRSSICLFLGYNSSHKGYLYLSTAGKIYISRHVVFDKTHFPYFLKDNPFLISKTLSTQTVLHSNPLIDIPSNLSNESINTYVSLSNFHDSRYTTLLLLILQILYNLFLMIIQ